MIEQLMMQVKQFIACIVALEYPAMAVLVIELLLLYLSILLLYLQIVDFRKRRSLYCGRPGSAPAAWPSSPVLGHGISFSFNPQNFLQKIRQVILELA